MKELEKKEKVRVRLEDERCDEGEDARASLASFVTEDEQEKKQKQPEQKCRTLDSRFCDIENPGCPYN